jgi:MFS family permease
VSKVEDTRRADLEAQAEGLRARMPNHSLRVIYLLTAVTAVDWASRSTLAVAFDDIKAEFHLRDWDLGALVAAFTVVATLSVIPCGILADRWKRVRLIAIGFVPWGIGMLWQGAATSFAMLFIARMFLGAIEATNGPASESLIGDYYPVTRRARIMGIWRLGFLIGSSLGAVIAGAIVDGAGWRASFVVFGLLGFLCGGIVLKWLPDPQRGVPDALHEVESQLADLDLDSGGGGVGVGGEGAAAIHLGLDGGADAAVPADMRTISLADAFRQLVKIRTAWVMVLGASIGEFVFSGLGAWAISFFRRYHGMSASEAGGVQFFILLGVIGGTIVGSRLGDRYLAENRHEQRVVLGAAFFGLGWLVSIPAFATDTTWLSIALLTVVGFCIYVPIPGLWAMWFDIIPAPLRGRASSLFTIVRVAFAASAPALIGAISTATSLRTAFLVVMPAQLINGVVLLFARSSYRADAARARQATRAQVNLEAV